VDGPTRQRFASRRVRIALIWWSPKSLTPSGKSSSRSYSFTSVPILAALKAAHGRGVDVEVIVDKISARQSKSGSRYSAATYLTNAGIPVWVDTKVAIAHNKVMVIDEQWVITGSFNFTASAQERNAENLLVLEDPALAAQYRTNWERRQASSAPYVGALPSGPVEGE
jgi:phosphatidylserine/phosphatidylglycerophosphate/cardiolipin synthase-like enzyme